jgi:5-methylcytosine-specific restriction endonuclease McrA
MRKTKYCPDCGKEIHHQATRCGVCAGKLRKKEPNKCINCGKEIERKAIRCGHCAQLGRNNHQYKNGWTTEDRRCSICGEKISLSSSGLCQKCYNENIEGENNPNYKDGRSLNNPYYSPEYKEWRRTVFERDNYTCKQCGNKESGSFEAHHILPRRDYQELMYDINNGITLCKKCHEATFGKEMNFVEKFQNLINQNN